MNKNLIKIIVIGAILVVLAASGVLYYNYTHKSTPQVKNITPAQKNEIYQAILDRDTDIYSKYINDGNDLSFAFTSGDDKGKTPLEMLIQNNDLENAQKLMDNGFDLEKVDNNHMDTLTNIISYNSDFNYDLINNITIELVDQVKDDIEKEDTFHSSILINTITTNNQDVIKEILKYTTDINKVYNNETALSYACNLGFNNLDVIKELVQAGADINYKGDEGDNCLMNAISTGQNDIVSYLLTLPQLDINAVNDYGQTALHLCVEYTNIDAIDNLLQNSSINTTIQDEDGYTAKSYAEELASEHPDDTDYTDIANKL